MSQNLNGFLLTNFSKKLKIYNQQQNIILLPDSNHLNKSEILGHSFIDVNKILDEDWEFIDKVEILTK